MKSTLFLGRFQPFHLGHLDAIVQIFEHFPEDFLLIGIGSANADFRPENPFSAGERAEMIFAALDAAQISREKYNLFSIPDINHFSLYPAFVQKTIPPFVRLFSGSPLLRRIFSENSSVEVLPLQDRTSLSATQIREKIKRGEDIRDLVPPVVADFLEKKHARDRLLALEKHGF